MQGKQYIPIDLSFFGEGDFKHYKEAEARMDELKKGLDASDAETAALEDEARNTETSVERREEIIKVMPEKITQRSTIQNELDAVTMARDKLKAAEERQIGLINSLSTGRIIERAASLSGDVRESRQYELAWARAILTGDQAEARALINTSDNALLVPKTLAQKIEDAMFTGGRIINLCNNINVKGLTEYPVVSKKTDPELHEELNAGKTDGTAKKEKELEITSVTMEPQFIAETLRTTRKFEADSIEAFFTWLMAELPDALRRVVDAKIIKGEQTTANGVRGIVTNTGAAFVETLADHLLNFNTANQAVALLDDGIEDNLTFVMNRRTFFNNVMGLKDTTGRPIYIVETDNEKRTRYLIGGFPVVFSSALSAYDTAVPGEAYIVAGNFDAYTLNFPQGTNVRIIRDEITEMKKNIINYLSEIYAAGNITKLGAFVKVTKAGLE